jgi:dihydropteroate synthase
LIIDPGFGFAKSLEQNYELLAGLGKLKRFGLPILVGISRKSMIYKLLGITPEDALPATSALHLEALRLGASILRVHDTREAVQVIKLHEALSG